MGLRSLPLGPQFKLSGSSDSLCFGKLEELPEKHFKDIGTHLLLEHSPSARLTRYLKSTAPAASAGRRRTTFHRSPTWCAGAVFQVRRRRSVVRQRSSPLRLAGQRRHGRHRSSFAASSRAALGANWGGESVLRDSGHQECSRAECTPNPANPP